MTRWKLEFRLWAAREKLAAFSVPKRWEDYRVAQAVSRVYDSVWRSDEFQEAVRKDIEARLMGGPMMYVSQPNDPANWLAE